MYLDLEPCGAPQNFPGPKPCRDPFFTYLPVRSGEHMLGSGRAGTTLHSGRGNNLKQKKIQCNCSENA